MSLILMLKKNLKTLKRCVPCIYINNGSIWEGHRNLHLEEALKNNWETKDDILTVITPYKGIEKLREELKRIIKYYVNKPYLSVYYTGVRIETLIGCIKRFSREEYFELNSFLNIINKFNIK